MYAPTRRLLALLALFALSAPAAAPRPAQRWEMGRSVDAMTDEVSVWVATLSDPVRDVADASLFFSRGPDGALSVAVVGRGGLGWMPKRRQPVLVRIGASPATSEEWISGADGDVLYRPGDAEPFARAAYASADLRIRTESLIWSTVTLHWPVDDRGKLLLGRLLRGEGPPPPAPSEF